MNGSRIEVATLQRAIFFNFFLRRSALDASNCSSLAFYANCISFSLSFFLIIKEKKDDAGRANN